MAAGFAASGNVYAGVLGGVSTRSGGARSVLTPTQTAISLYSPENGLALGLLVGRHLSDYLTLQAHYVWKRNALTLTSATFSPGGRAAFPETRGSSQQSLIGDVLVYFRKRGSRLRPYLSVGTGVIHLSSDERALEVAVGSPVLPARHFSSTRVGLRVPVGMDVALRGGWVFRSARLVLPTSRVPNTNFI